MVVRGPDPNNAPDPFDDGGDSAGDDDDGGAQPAGGTDTDGTQTEGGDIDTSDPVDDSGGSSGGGGSSDSDDGSIDDVSSGTSDGARTTAPDPENPPDPDPADTADDPSLSDPGIGADTEQQAEGSEDAAATPNDPAPDAPDDFTGPDEFDEGDAPNPEGATSAPPDVADTTTPGGADPVVPGAGGGQGERPDEIDAGQQERENLAQQLEAQTGIGVDPSRLDTRRDGDQIVTEVPPEVRLDIRRQAAADRAGVEPGDLEFRQSEGPPSVTLTDAAVQEQEQEAAEAAREQLEREITPEREGPTRELADDEVIVETSGGTAEARLTEDKLRQLAAEQNPPLEPRDLTVEDGEVEVREGAVVGGFGREVERAAVQASEGRERELARERFQAAPGSRGASVDELQSGRRAVAADAVIDDAAEGLIETEGRGDLPASPAAARAAAFEAATGGVIPTGGGPLGPPGNFERAVFAAGEAAAEFGQEQIVDPGSQLAGDVLDARAQAGQFRAGAADAEDVVQSGGDVARGEENERQDSSAIETGTQRLTEGAGDIIATTPQAPEAIRNVGTLAFDASKFTAENPVAAPAAGAGFAASRLSTAFQQAAKNPVRTTGQLVGSAVLFGGAGAVSSKLGLASRAAIQPGEELAGFGGAATFRGASKGLSKAADVVPEGRTSAALSKTAGGTAKAGRTLFPQNEPLIMSEEAGLLVAGKAAQLTARGAKAARRRAPGLSELRRINVQPRAGAGLVPPRFELEGEGETVTAEDLDVDEFRRTGGRPGQTPAQERESRAKERAREARQRRAALEAREPFTATTEVDPEGPRSFDQPDPTEIDAPSTQDLSRADLQRSGPTPSQRAAFRSAGRGTDSDMSPRERQLAAQKRRQEAEDSSIGETADLEREAEDTRVAEDIATEEAVGTEARIEAEGRVEQAQRMLTFETESERVGVRSDVRSRAQQRLDQRLDVRAQPRPRLDERVGTDVESRVGADLETELEGEFEQEVESELEQEVEVETEAETETETELETEAEAEVETELETEVEQEVEPPTEIEVEAEFGEGEKPRLSEVGEDDDDFTKKFSTGVLSPGDVLEADDF